MNPVSSTRELMTSRYIVQSRSKLLAWFSGVQENWRIHFSWKFNFLPYTYYSAPQASISDIDRLNRNIRTLTTVNFGPQTTHNAVIKKFQIYFLPINQDSFTAVLFTGEYLGRTISAGRDLYIDTNQRTWTLHSLSKSPQRYLQLTLELKLNLSWVA